MHVVWSYYKRQLKSVLLADPTTTVFRVIRISGLNMVSYIPVTLALCGHAKAIAFCWPTNIRLSFEAYSIYGH